jgi:SM-20-related protein
MAMSAVQERFIDLGLFERTKLETDPFPYILVPGFVPEAARAALAADYPKIDRPGSFPTADLRFGAAFAAFLAEIEGPAMRASFARKFDIDLAGRPTMVTVRGQAQSKDGSIHTDTASKLITVLVYMNEAW